MIGTSSPVSDGHNPGMDAEGTAWLKYISGRLKPKDMAPIPWMVALALQADGWWLRSDIIWHKPNPMPESIRDRPTKAHEYVFLLSKTARYFYDAEAVRMPARWPDGPNAPGAISSPYGQGFTRRAKRRSIRPGVDVKGGGQGNGEITYPSETANLHDVWTIPAEAFPDAHFATFPKALVVPCVKAGSSEKGACPECGAAWVREVDVTYDNPGNRTTNGSRSVERRHETAGFDVRLEKRTETRGWRPSCKHTADPVPCVVLDPFAGSGTTGVVALRHGRSFVGIELSPEYAEMARQRIIDDAPLFNPQMEVTG